MNHTPTWAIALFALYAPFTPTTLLASKAQPLTSFGPSVNITEPAKSRPLGRKSFEEYCTDTSLPADQRVFVDAVLRNLVTTDCADPQRFVDAYGGFSIMDDKVTTIKPIDGFSNLTYVMFQRTTLRDLSPLTIHQDLESVWVVDSLVEDISPLAQLPKLQRLRLDKNRITDMSTLAKLKNLTNLRLDDNDITDFSALAAMPQLEALSIGYPQSTLYDRCVYPRLSTKGLATSLRSLTKLTKLKANSLDIADASAIAAMKDLQTLHLDCNQLSDAAFVDSLPKLSDLALSFNPLTKVAITKPNDTIKWLAIRGTGINDLAFLNHLPNLTYLDLSHNEIFDGSPIGSLVQLGLLKANGNRMQDVSFIENLAALSGLELQDNDIAAFPFGKLSPEVLSLRLSGNVLSHVVGIEHIPNIAQLTLANNPITDISPMAKLPRHQLTYLDLSSTDITDLSPLAGINLYGLWLDDGNISSLEQLPSFPDLDILSMKKSGLSSIAGLFDRYGEMFGLFLSQNPITDLSELRRHSNFHYLELAGITAGSLDVLKNLRQLIFADFSAMEVSSIEPLRNITGLTELKLNDNRIVDLSPLHNIGHQYLNRLELADNAISSIAPLSNKKLLRHLYRLNLKGNPLGTTTQKSQDNCPTDGWSKAVTDWCRQDSREDHQQRYSLPPLSSAEMVSKLIRDHRAYRKSQR